MRKELVFLAKFFAIYFVLQWLVLAAPLGALQQLIAAVEAGWLGLNTAGNIVQAGNGFFEISASCTGLVSASVLAAVVFSLKKPAAKEKVVLFAVGAVVLFLLNFARVYLVLAIAIGYGVELAELAHTVSWFSTAVLVLILWYVGTKRLAKIDDFSELM